MSDELKELQSVLVSLERGFWEAAGKGSDFYVKNFAENGVMVLPFEGGILRKSQTIEATKQAKPWKNYDLKDPQLLRLSSSDVVLIYKASGERPDEANYNAYISSVYNKTGNSWQLVLHQQTPFSSSE